MRRLVFHLLFVVLMVSLLTGCGGEPAEPAPPPKSEPVQATLQPVKSMATVEEPATPVPTETTSPAGPVLGADGKPILFPDGVPVPLPEDLGIYNLTYYGYQTATMKEFVPNDVFKDKAKYSDTDRKNARTALQYILDSMTVQEEAQGAKVNQNVYGWHLLARIHAHRYYDTGDEQELETALSFYEKCREQEYAASIGDHQALLLAAGRDLPDEWK